MPEHLRALTVILGLALVTLLVAKPAFSGSVMERAEFSRRVTAWLVITLVTFLSHNPWVFLVGSVAFLYLYQRQESNPLALFFILLFAVPPIRFEIPGFGVVNYVANLNHARVLALVVLVPAFLHLRRQDGVVPFGRTLADKLLLSFLCLTVLMALRETTLTDTLREAFYAFLEVFLPYYVASRGIRNMHSMREAMAGFVIAAMILGAVALFEMFKGWLLYVTVPEAIGVERHMGGYLTRGAALRALASTGQPIVLGYVMVVAIGFLLIVRQGIEKTWMRHAALGFLVAGMLASISRGPWVGAVVLVFVFATLAPRPVTRLAKLSLFVVAGVMGVLLLPGGGKVIDLLPFVGTVDSVNVTYRERLFENATTVIERNPWLGSVIYNQTPEMQAMIQGQGIIDIVNSYLGIALEYGFIGLSLFFGFFLAVLFGIRSTMRCSVRGGEMRSVGAGLMATLTSILIMIYTVSSINTIPVVYWAVAGLGASYIAMGTAARHRVFGTLEEVKA